LVDPGGYVGQLCFSSKKLREEERLNGSMSSRMTGGLSVMASSKASRF
jgi:hypothetical protein